jgi:hypothetical protein
MEKQKLTLPPAERGQGLISAAFSIPFHSIGGGGVFWSHHTVCVNVITEQPNGKRENLINVHACTCRLNKVNFKRGVTFIVSLVFMMLSGGVLVLLWPGLDWNMLDALIMERFVRSNKIQSLSL